MRDLNRLQFMSAPEGNQTARVAVAVVGGEVVAHARTLADALTLEAGWHAYMRGRPRAHGGNARERNHWYRGWDRARAWVKQRSRVRQVA